MTWEELKEKAIEMGAEVYEDFIIFQGLYFDKNGDILMRSEGITSDRTPEQMLMIMRGLE